MSNNARGTIWMDPAQFQVPKSDCTQQPANVSFFGHVKVSQRKMEAAPPDPALRYKSVGAGWRRPAWTPLPEQECTAILTEGWKFTIQPPENYWLNDSDLADWDDVTVPAELMALGYDIKRDREYVYKKKLDIPAEWKDKVGDPCGESTEMGCRTSESLPAGSDYGSRWYAVDLCSGRGFPKDRA